MAIACENAWALGMVVVKSAGNNGPAPGTVTRPGEADILVVGATDRRGAAVGDYSSRGPLHVDGMTLDRPHLVAPGGLPDEPFKAYDLDERFGPVGHGTSYAAPRVAGVAALLLEQDPSLGPDGVRDNIYGTCRSLAGDSSAEGKGLLVLP